MKKPLLSRFYILLMIGGYLFFGRQLPAQELAANHLTSSASLLKNQQESKKLIDVLYELESKYGITFDYDPNMLKGKQVKASFSLDMAPKDIDQILTQVLTPYQLKYEKMYDQSYLILEGNTQPKLEKRPATSLLNQWAPPRPEAIRRHLMKSVDSHRILEKTITGRVTDLSTDEGLPGVNIVVKNTTIGTVTDIDGNYRLTAPDDAETLVFSSVGYTSEEVAIGNQTVVNLEMAPDIQSLSEIVVVGYGTQRRADLTGSIASVAPEEIARVPVATLQQSLQGQAAGVEVTSNNGAPGQGAVVRIRGVGSTGNTNPLYVVDGVPVSDPNLVNPLDIESIQVLKDASASAIYGSRGANGVIIITTKRGESGEPKFSLDAYYGLQSAWRTVEMANNQEYAELVKELNENGIAEGISGASVPETAENILANPAQYGEGTDWTDAIFRTAPIQNHGLFIKHHDV